MVVSQIKRGGNNYIMISNVYKSPFSMKPVKAWLPTSSDEPENG